VYVEGESRKIGLLRVPEALIQQLREHGRCIRVELDGPARLRLLLEEYGHFAEDVDGFVRLLDGLIELRGRETVQAWQAQARAGEWPQVFGALMQRHYDPLYERSLRSGYRLMDQALQLQLPDAEPATLRAAVAGLPT
jgi:tRNA 2-selenouridine synthase